MDLRDAVRAALRFVEKPKDKKQTTPRECVRFLPGEGLLSSWVCACSDRCGVMARVDEEVPNTLLRGDFLTKVVRQAKHTLTMDLAEYGGVVLNTGATRYTVAHDMIPSLGLFPAVPAVPEVFQTMEFGPVGQVLHAASKDAERANLRAIHFTPGYVAATDQHRVARAWLKGGWQGLLPAELFQKIPLTTVIEVAFRRDLVFVRVQEDEVRFAAYVPFAFPECAKLVPDAHEGPGVVADVQALARAVKQAADVSETGSVRLQFEPTAIQLTAWRVKSHGLPREFNARVGAVPYQDGKGEVMVHGKNLGEALGAVRTPRVRLRFGTAADPLRIESAGYVEALWPMLV